MSLTMKTDAANQSERQRLIEEILTFKEIALLYRWSYDTVRRYFKNNPDTVVKYTPNPAKRPKKMYWVPKSVVLSEWNKMQSFNKRTKAA